MKTHLFEILEAERRSGTVTTVRDWLAAHPPPEGSLRQTLALVAERALHGEPFAYAVREFLDEFAVRHTRELQDAAIADRPVSTGDARQDTYLAALAEHLAHLHDLERPQWACEPSRFLDRVWFVSDIRGFRALAIAESPAAFRRRGIFIARSALDRC